MNINKKTYNNSNNASHQPAHTHSNVKWWLFVHSHKQGDDFFRQQRQSFMEQGLEQDRTRESRHCPLGVREIKHLRLAAEVSSKNMTLDKYLKQKEAIRKQLIKDRESRITENGGCTLTQETREKLVKHSKKIGRKGK